MSFPLAIADEIKQALKPLLDPVGVARHFVFVPSAPFPHTVELETTDGKQSLPRVFLTVITSKQLTSTGRKVSAILSNADWVTVEGLPPAAFPGASKGNVFAHTSHSEHVPLIALTTGQAGGAMEDGIRLTLLCGDTYESTVVFYSLILGANPLNGPDHTLFSLMVHPTSVLELCLVDSPSLKTHPLHNLTIHVFTEDMPRLATELVKRCRPDTIEFERRRLLLVDPCGNTVVVHDRAGMEHTA